jgi:hypothetical protein
VDWKVPGGIPSLTIALNSFGWMKVHRFEIVFDFIGKIIINPLLEISSPSHEAWEVPGGIPSLIVRLNSFGWMKVIQFWNCIDFE